jgi:hypothetical protein
MSSLSTSAPAALPARSATAGGTFRLIAASLVLVPLTLSPLLWASVPPLVDYPNHLARMWILAQNGALPDLASNYAIAWRVLPNLAMDLIVPALAQIMPLEVAGRLFIALIMLSLVAGTMALHRALHGRLTLWPLSALLFLYDAALFWGFLNCLFGIGMFLLTFSGWIASRRWRAAPRIVTFAAIASLLLILHLFAFCLYALAVGTYELGRRLAEGKLSLRALVSLGAVGLQFIPGMLLWIASLSNFGASYTRYGDLAAKAYALQAPFTFGPTPILLDRAMLIFSLGFLIVAIGARALKLAPEMRLPLAAMVLAAVAMPTWLSASWLSDIRLPVALPFVLIASAQLDVSRFRAVGGFAAVALVLLGIRVGAVSASWRDTDRSFAEFRTASQAITPGARLLIVGDEPTAGRPFEDLPSVLARQWDETFSHMAALAVIDRSAFIPSLFTGATPVRPTRRNAGLFHTQTSSLSPELLAQSMTSEQMSSLDVRPNFLGELPYWGNWPKNFDFVLWIDFDRIASPDLTPLRPAARGSFFSLYRVVRP